MNGGERSSGGEMIAAFATRSPILGGCRWEGGAWCSMASRC